MSKSAMTYTAEKYIADVKAKRIPVCKWVTLAVKRHLGDLRRAGAKDFPYHFDPKYAQRAIDFMQTLEHTKGEFANRALYDDVSIRLEGWQQFIVWMLEGWRDANGYRRFTRAYIEVARKNGKSTWAAAFANYHFFADRPKEMGPEIYFAATKQSQAKIAWSEAERQIFRDSELKTIARFYRSANKIVIENEEQGSSASVMRPLGRDHKTEDGLNPSLAVIDEYHAHPDAHMIEVLESGMGARKQPLTLIITTAGKNYSCPCFEEHEHLKKMLEGAIPPVDHVWGIIYTLDENDDWKDPKVWIKANPNLGVSVNEKHLAQTIKLAKSNTAKINNVKTKNLNIWCRAANGWIAFENWRECGKASYAAEDLKRRRCFGGMDLSSTQDLTALCLSFPPVEEGEPYKHLYRFFMPGELVRDKEDHDKVPYTAWIEQGFITATPGNVIDYDWIERAVMEWAERYEIQEFCYDPFHAQECVNHLTDAGINMVPIRQTYQYMAPMVDVFEKKTLAREMAYGGNPIMDWMICCVETKSDRQGNIMLMKPKRDTAGKKIDGVIANVMALGRAALQTQAGASVYEERGVLIL